MQRIFHPLALVSWVCLFGLVGCSSGGDSAGENSGPAGKGGNSASGGAGGERGGSAGTSGSAGESGGSASGGAGANTGGSGAAGAGGEEGGAGAGAAGGNGAAGNGGGEERVDAAAPVADAADGAAGMGDPSALPKFSFFYTSLEAMRRLSESQDGFGGDLRFGETTGIAGADKICQTIATEEGFGAKQWRAFLSVVEGPEGMPIHAIDRIGEGPWYDRNERLISMDLAGLTAGDRPRGDRQTINDLPDEKGLGTRRLGDTHDVITGSDEDGRLRVMNKASTCQDWTSVVGRGPIWAGHSWPAPGRAHWISEHTERNCAAGVNLRQNGPGDGSSIGAGGGWGGFYCFALTP